MGGQISASMMCANFLDIRGDLSALKQAGIEYLHYDVMDGVFVPNYALGPCFLNSLRAHTDITYDIHLMVERPEDKLRYFDICAGDYVSVHYEAACHLQRVLANIKEAGAHPGVALNPGTPICVLEEVLDDIDFVLIMTVNPGFAGQKLVKQTIDKITRVKEYLIKSCRPDIKIQVDGNVSFENARIMRDAGADIFIAGTSGLFMKGLSIQEAAEQLRAAIK